MKLTAIAIVLAMALGATALAEKIPVFIGAGQSNMLGGRPIDQLPPDLQQPQVGIRYAYQLIDLVDGQDVIGGWIDLRPLPEVPNTTYGPELSFMRKMAAQIDETPAFIKVARNGSSLHQWMPATNLYYPVLTNFVREKMDELTVQGNEPYIAGFIWVQGTSDSSNPTTAATYDDRLIKLWGALQVEFGTSAPLIFNLQHHETALFDPICNAVALPVIRQSQMNVALLEKQTRIVDIDDQALDDCWHIDSPGVVELGDRMAHAWMLERIDLNNDGIVNVPDQLILMNNWLWSSPPGIGDFNLDGVVSVPDLILMLNNWGQ